MACIVCSWMFQAQALPIADNDLSDVAAELKQAQACYLNGLTDDEISDGLLGKLRKMTADSPVTPLRCLNSVCSFLISQKTDHQPPPTISLNIDVEKFDCQRYRVHDLENDCG